MDRLEVYKLIDTEREYQNTVRRINEKETRNDNEKSVSDFILYINRTLNKAEDSIYSLDEINAMGYIRKIAGLAVAAMEAFETPPRKLPLKQGDTMGGSWGTTKDGKDITIGFFDFTGNIRVAHILHRELFTEDPAEFAKKHKLSEIMYHEKF